MSFTCGLSPRMSCVLQTLFGIILDALTLGILFCAHIAPDAAFTLDIPVRKRRDPAARRHTQILLPLRRHQDHSGPSIHP